MIHKTYLRWSNSSLKIASTVVLHIFALALFDTWFATLFIASLIGCNSAPICLSILLSYKFSKDLLFLSSLDTTSLNFKYVSPIFANP